MDGELGPLSRCGVECGCVSELGSPTAWKLNIGLGDILWGRTDLSNNSWLYMYKILHHNSHE
jgi:hypothetical protein